MVIDFLSKSALCTFITGVTYNDWSSSQIKYITFKSIPNLQSWAWTFREAPKLITILWQIFWTGNACPSAIQNLQKNTKRLHFLLLWSLTVCISDTPLPAGHHCESRCRKNIFFWNCAIFFSCLPKPSEKIHVQKYAFLRIEQTERGAFETHFFILV